MSLFRSLKFKVVVGSAFLFISLFGIYSYLVLRAHTAQMMSQITDSAARVSDIIKNSTRYSMLLNRRPDVYQIIATIGREPGVEGIRIYNKRGEIMVSTNEAEESKVVDMRAEACYACHDSEKPLQSLPISERARTYEAAGGRRIMGLINPVRNEPACSNAECHAHPADRTVLGVLDVRMSLEKVDASIAQAKRQFILFSLLTALLAGGAAALFLLLTVHRPVERLIEGTKQVGTGNLDHEIPIRSEDEIGQLARSFNEMTGLLRQAREQDETWSRTLEKRIAEKTEELQRVHRQILQIEKMACLGRLSATVAHELNNPLEGILNYAKLNARRLRKAGDQSLQPTIEDLDLITHEVQRCGNIVKNLLLFSKKQVGEFGAVPVGTVLDRAIQLVQHHFEIRNITLERDFRAVEATLLCDENQIQQALMALLINAAEATQPEGSVRVTMRLHASGSTIIEVADSGSGIAAEDLPHIFEPFFTTKKEGKGLGLGLSVVYGIVERHGGTVAVRSEPGRGTVFSLTFPPAAQPRPRLEAGEALAGQLAAEPEAKTV